MCGGPGMSRAGELNVFCNGECVQQKRNVDINSIAVALIQWQAQSDQPVFGVFIEQVGGREVKQQATLAAFNIGVNWNPHTE